MLRAMAEDEIAELRIVAEHIGLELTDEELREVAPGVKRIRRYAESLRAIIDGETEPAPVFEAERPDA